MSAQLVTRLDCGDFRMLRWFYLYVVFVRLLIVTFAYTSTLRIYLTYIRYIRIYLYREHGLSGSAEAFRGSGLAERDSEGGFRHGHFTLLSMLSWQLNETMRHLATLNEL